MRNLDPISNFTFAIASRKPWKWTSAESGTGHQPNGPGLRLKHKTGANKRARARAQATHTSIARATRRERGPRMAAEFLVAVASLSKQMRSAHQMEPDWQARSLARQAENNNVYDETSERARELRIEPPSQRKLLTAGLWRGRALAWPGLGSGLGFCRWRV